MKVSFKSGQAATYVYQDTNGGALLRLEGFVTGTQNTVYFIHIFDTQSVTAPSNGTTPKRSLQVLGQDGFRFVFTDENLEFTQGIIFALSSSEETYTAVADGAKVDWEGDVETLAVQGLTTVGDLSTAVNGLAVWTNAQGPRFLFEVDWVAGSGAASFLMFFTKDSPVNGDVPDAVIGNDPTSPGSTTKLLRFGRSGLSLRSQSGTRGCTLKISSTGTSLTAIAVSGDLLRAKYKTNL